MKSLDKGWRSPLKVEVIKIRLEGRIVWRTELGDIFERILHVQWDKGDLRVYIRNNSTDIEVDNLGNESVEVTFVITGIGR